MSKRATTVKRHWTRSETSLGCTPTFSNRNEKQISLGPITGLAASHRIAASFATHLVPVFASYNTSGVNEWSDRSHTYAIPVAASVLGFAGLKGFTSVTCQRR